MSQTLRVILLTGNAEFVPELRRAVTALPQVRIVAELDEPSLIGQAVLQFPCDLIIADLDPSASLVIEVLRQLRTEGDPSAAGAPAPAIFAVSKSTEGDVVLRAMKAGVREFFVKPLNPEEFQQALGKLIEVLPNVREPGKLVSIIGSCGGVGCTTIATNLAVELAGLVPPSQKVALVDLDFRFGHVATLLDIHGQYTVADLCSTQEQLDPEMIMKALIRHESGLYVLRRPHSFAQAEMITAAHCASVLTSLQEMCAYVIVDGPTRHDPGGRTVLDTADHMFLILQLLVTSVRNTDRIMQELTSQGFSSERVAFIVNRLGRESAHLEVDQVETILNRKIFASIVDDWKSVGSSINIGRPLKDQFERTKIRQDIRELAQRIHCPGKHAASRQANSGLFGKLLSRVAKSSSQSNTSDIKPVAPVTV